VVRRLLHRGHDVCGLDDLSTGHLRNLPGDAIPGWEFVHGDIRESNTCRDAVRGSDAVVHLAARNSVPSSLADPRSALEVNVLGTFELLEACREEGDLRFVFASSSSAYGDDPHFPKHEGARLLPRSPYAATKASGEQLIRAWARCWGVKAIGLRFFNVFGPRQDPDRPYSAVIPLFIKAALNGVPATIHGDGTQSRDFTYVDNVVRGVECALEAPARSFGEVYNIACGDSVELMRVHTAIGELLGGPIPPVHAPPRAGDVPHSQADITAARRDLHYETEVPFEEGIERTVEWYRSQG
jgi:UDP-N-acetylglucosamine/UDP-N-acetylgalactosamine 4-epimerase